MAEPTLSYAEQLARRLEDNRGLKDTPSWMVAERREAANLIRALATQIEDIATSLEQGPSPSFYGDGREGSVDGTRATYFPRTSMHEMATGQGGSSPPMPPIAIHCKKVVRL